ncbi:MAG: hypothetical protein KAT58_09985 [candidate division Zixibacteria bacterium]|nr:hypothetical protein [candidate division Zixibacteria bacterium]
MAERYKQVNRITFPVLALMAMLAVAVNARQPETFAEAKTLAAEQDKPLLMEFFRQE